MSTVELDDQEWQAVLAMMALAPWRDVNPLLMKIGQQLQLQQSTAIGKAHIRAKADGKEIRHE